MEESSGNAEFIPRTDTRHPARPDEVLPETLQLVPLNSRPYFPVLIQPIVVDKEPWGEGLKVVAESAHKLVGLCFVTRPVEDEPRPDDLAEIGCVARIHRIQKTGDKLQFIAQGLRRFRIVDAEYITKLVGAKFPASQIRFRSTPVDPNECTTSPGPSQPHNSE